MATSKSPYKAEMRLTSLNTDWFRGLLFQMHKNSTCITACSNAINTRSL